MEVGIEVDGFVFFSAWVMRFSSCAGWFGGFRTVAPDMFPPRTHGKPETHREPCTWLCPWACSVQPNQAELHKRSSTPARKDLFRITLEFWLLRWKRMQSGESFFFFPFFGHTSQPTGSYFPNPHPLQWKCGVLTTGPPGRSQESF